MTQIPIPPLDSYKVIKDPIHGFVPLTRLEYEILQIPAFTRLHDIKQMSMAFLVFPGAVATRFTHSVGTMHLASRMAYQLLQHLDGNYYEELFPGVKKPTDLLGIIETVRLAALLHDVGHGPYSHATEEVMRECLQRAHPVEYREAKRFFHAHDEDFAVHEYFSYRIVKSPEVSALIRREELREGGSGEAIPVSAENVAAVIAKHEKPAKDFCTDAGISVLRKIVSGQLDADRMDYLVRDAHMSGAPYGIVDVDRIITQMSVRKDKWVNSNWRFMSGQLAASRTSSMPASRCTSGSLATTSLSLRTRY